VRPGTVTARHYFSWSGGDRYGFNKKRAPTRYAELVFLHPVGSAGCVVHYGASRARNNDALFFMLVWDRHGFDKRKCAGKHYTELVVLHLLGSAGRVVHAGASRA
jgi:hypothetical protein